MRRKSFDFLTSAIGLVLALGLFIASGLLLWAHSFADSNVRTQLTAQKIFFPAAGTDSLNDPLVKPYLEKYAGQQLTTGAQAQAFADHYIAVHLTESTGGLTYSELSNQARANPTDAKLKGQVETAFKGETLRGMLLNAYAFGKMGQIALYAGFVSLGGGALLLVLSGLGLVHARRTDADAQVHVPGWHPENVATS